MSETARPIVLIAASAGGIEALMAILAALPRDFPAPIVVVQHRSPTRTSLLPSVLSLRSALPVFEAHSGEPVKPGIVYIARPDEHLTVTEESRFAYTDGQRIRHVRSSANPLFISVSQIFGPRTIGVVLSGSGSDATDGVQSIKARGGVVIAQNQATARHFGMPAAAIATGAVDYVLPLEEIAPAIVRLTSGELPAQCAARDDRSA